jgi:hypothetical protein
MTRNVTYFSTPSVEYLKRFYRIKE